MNFPINSESVRRNVANINMRMLHGVIATSSMYAELAMSYVGLNGGLIVWVSLN